jgi:hypothetical protein
MKKRVFLYIALAIALTLQTDKAPTSLNASNLASVEAGRSGLGSDLAPEATAAGLRDAFRDPPAEFRPLPMIHSHALQDPAVSQWLSDRHAGGAVIDAGVKPGTHDIDGEAGNNPTWLNDPAQFERLRKTILQLHQDGRRVWLYDENGYPSGNAGGGVLRGHPEFQAQLVGCETFHARGGQTVDVAAQKGPVVACQAIPVREGKAVLPEAKDLTGQMHGGSLHWTAPAGEWVVCLFQHYASDTWRRHDQVHRNVNIMDPRATDRFIELTHARYALELGNLLKDVDAIFTDEPQLSSADYWGETGLEHCAPAVQWIDDLPQAFRHKFGYDVVPILPALFLDAGDRTTKYRHDFYDVQSDLVAENYFGRIERWCRDHGIALTGHLLLEESLLFHVMFSGSMVKDYQRMDMPGVDLLLAVPYHTMPFGSTQPSAQQPFGTPSAPEDFSCKLASSMSHLSGKKGTISESFALATQLTVRRAYGVMAWQYSGGITYISTYIDGFSAADYAAFSDFTGRLALLCRRGRHVADVAVLVPESSIWASYNPPNGGHFSRYLQCNPDAVHINNVFRDTCLSLMSHQRDFDMVSEAHLQNARISDGRIHIGGESFHVLVMPEVRMLDPKTLAAVRAFVQSGGFVALVGALPSQTPQNGMDANITGQARSLLSSFPERTVRITDAAQIKMLLDWLNTHAPGSIKWDGPEGVRLLQRREPGRTMVLLANPGKTQAEGRLTVPTVGRASLWNPETGEVSETGPVAIHAAVPIAVPGESARFLVIEEPRN